MADEQSMTVREALGKVLGDEHADVLRESVRMILGELMEAEVAKLAGAERYEHSPERVAQRNGYRLLEWDTRVGTPHGSTRWTCGASDFNPTRPHRARS
jgi:putative transposase